MVRYVHMFMPSEGKGLEEATEYRITPEAPKYEINVLQRHELLSLEHGIIGLGYNALDRGMSRTKRGTRKMQKERVHEMLKRIAESPRNKLVLVAKEAGKIAGFIVVDREGEDARLEHLWTDTGDITQQPQIIAHLITDTLNSLSAHKGPSGQDFRRLYIPAIARSSKAIRKAIRLLPENARSKVMIEDAGEDAPANDNESRSNLKEVA